MTPALPPDRPFDATMQTAQVAVAAVALLMALIALFAVGWALAVGVAVGGLIATLNLWVFARVGRGVLAQGQRRSLWALAGALKLIVLIAAVFLLMHSGWVSGVSLAIGYGALPLGITLAGLVSPRTDLPVEASGAAGKDLVTAPTRDRPQD